MFVAENGSSFGRDVTLSASRSLSKEGSLSPEHPASVVLEAFAQEGLFEAARLANPILPQYHPKQLIVLLNGGRTKRVKAILLHMLKSLKVTGI